MASLPGNPPVASTTPCVAPTARRLPLRSTPTPRIAPPLSLKKATALASLQSVTPTSKADRSSRPAKARSEEHTSELQSLMRISYAVFCLKKKKIITQTRNKPHKQLIQKHRHQQRLSAH